MVLSYVFCEGYESYYLNEHGVPIVYDCVEDALADIQSEFDRWAYEIRRGEREPEDCFSEEEFLVSCANTGTNCHIENVHGTIFLIDEAGNFIKSKAEIETINRTGEFVHIKSYSIAVF